MAPVAVLLIIGTIVAVVVLGLGVLDYLSSPRRAVRNERTQNAKELKTKTHQLFLAKKALTKIAANDTGNPSLDANIALEDISAIELKELES